MIEEEIKKFESQECTCCEITWEPCDRCVKLVDLRKKFTTTEKLINPVKNPRYDDVYFEGLDWLDKL